MAELVQSLGELLAASRDADTKKLYTVKNDEVEKVYLDNLPQKLKDIKFGKEEMELYGSYNRDFSEAYHTTHGAGLAAFAKEHSEINNLSISSSLPGGVELGIDFARPTGDKVTKEEWSNSFGLRNSTQSNEGLAERLRETIGNLWDE